MSVVASPSPEPAQPHRLSGGLIDRSQRLRGRFDGSEIGGFGGDTLASALLANGVRLVGRSFKYHRPRGILTAGPEEPNALVELRGGARREPNTKATTIEMFDGLEATSQNRWPSLRLDFLSLNSLLAPFFPAGFYYKTFMWPPAFWERVYEPLIRSAAGLGRAAAEPDPDHYEQAYAFCDILIIGCGPAGVVGRAKCGALGRARPSLRARFRNRRAIVGRRPRNRRRARQYLGGQCHRRIARTVQRAAHDAHLRVRNL